MHADSSAVLKGKVNRGSLLTLQAASYLGPTAMRCGVRKQSSGLFKFTNSVSYA